MPMSSERTSLMSDKIGVTPCSERNSGVAGAAASETSVLVVMDLALAIPAGCCGTGKQCLRNELVPDRRFRGNFMPDRRFGAGPRIFHGSDAGMRLELSFTMRM